MAGKVLSKVMGIFGLEDEYEELEEEDEVENEGAEVECSDFPTKKQNKVVNIHTTTSTKVVIIKPQTFDEAAEICEDLKNRKIVVVNTINLETKVAQRLLDFMGGASYVLGGNLQEVEKSVYVLSPSNVAVSNDLKHELSSKGIFNFNR